MKKLLLTLTLGLLSFGLFAQIISISGDTVFASGSSNDFQFVAHGSIKNTALSSVNFKWVRMSNGLTANWRNAICDVIACYGDNTDSAEFSLGPNEIGNLDAHYYPGNTGGSGTTRVKVYEVGNPSNQVVLTFVGSTFAASVTEIKKLEFKLYPIPATDVLFLKASKNLTAGKIEIYNAIGKKMHEMVISNSQQAIEIPVHSLPKGNYILRVFNGKQIVSKSFIKQ